MTRNEITADLEWLARNVSEWNDAQTFANVMRWRIGEEPSLYWSSIAEDDHKVTQWVEHQWLQARQLLGLESPEVTEAEDEAWQAMEEKQADMVNNPPHYQLHEGYEVYDLRQDLARKAQAAGVPHDQYSDWDRALEYLLRMWEKNGVEDAKKGRWYMDKLIAKLEASALRAGELGE